MTDQGGAAQAAGAARRLYLVCGDSTFAAEASAGVRAALPPGWVLAEEPDGATVLIAIDAAVDADMLVRAGRDLRLIGTADADIDVLAADLDHVRVVTLPTEHQQSHQVVAEYTVTMMLALARNLLALARTATEHPWAPGRDTPALTDQRTYVYNWTGLEGSGYLSGKVAGIIGVGAIGSRVAQLLAPFGVRLRYTQRHRLSEAEEQRLRLEWREFDDLIRECDVITLHHRLQQGPGGSELQFGAREFAMMKPSAFLVNTSRGRILDEDALVEALRRGEIGGVALDVFHYEPLPKDHPLLALASDNVILTPHIAAGSDGEYWKHVVRTMIEAYDELSAPVGSA
jgi:phosphoglycerate dehydrogenase-like enzyme